MRRFFRIAVNALTVLSLVLAVLVAGLWVRSYWREDSLFFYHNQWFGKGHGPTLSSHRGHLYYLFMFNDGGGTGGRPGLVVQYRDKTLIPWLTYTVAEHRVPGFAAGSGKGSRFFFYDATFGPAAMVPHAAAVAAAAALPAARAVASLRRKRQRPGHCRVARRDVDERVLRGRAGEQQPEAVDDERARDTGGEGRKQPTGAGRTGEADTTATNLREQHKRQDGKHHEYGAGRLIAAGDIRLQDEHDAGDREDGEQDDGRADVEAEPATERCAERVRRLDHGRAGRLPHRLRRHAPSSSSSSSQRNSRVSSCACRSVISADIAPSPA